MVLIGISLVTGDKGDAIGQVRLVFEGRQFLFCSHTSV